jgi:hypothetical protein
MDGVDCLPQGLRTASPARHVASRRSPRRVLRQCAGEGGVNFRWRAGNAGPTKRFPIQFSSNRVSTPSLRANGSRECAPDDRLREAIHLAAQRKNGLLRFARNDVDMLSPSRDAMRPRFASHISCPSKNRRAQGKPGARCTRSRAWWVESMRVSHHRFTGTPGLPCAMVLTVSSALSLMTGLCCHHHRRDAEASSPT